MKYIVLALALGLGCCHGGVINNEVARDARRISSSNELLSSIVNDCFSAESSMECLKVKVLNYLDTILGFGEESSRAFTPNVIDKVIFDRVGRILNKNEFRLGLPESIFQGAEITYRADKGLDIAVPEDDEKPEGRDILKKKLLLPVLLLLKLKMKVLMPIFVALIGLKAFKALILSKLAIVLVIGFIAAQLLKKGGMAMPMAMMPTPEPPAPATAYGPAAPSSAYGAAPAPSAATPSDSYSPQWEPSASGPYSRVWDTGSSHNMAYSAYYPGSSGSSSGSSYSSPSSSSASSTSSITSSSSS